MDITRLSEELGQAVLKAAEYAVSRHHEYLTPEHLLYALCNFDTMHEAFFLGGVDPKEFVRDIEQYLFEMDGDDYEGYKLDYSVMFLHMTEVASQIANSYEREKINVPHVICAMLRLPDSMASYLLQKHFSESESAIMDIMVDSCVDENYDEESEIYDEDTYYEEKESDKPWKSHVSCINEHLEGRNPLIGRTAELERTIHILCRKDKNNPLYIGEPGVGKTALVYGLASMIEAGNVPDKLKGSKIYSMDVGSLLAGTQYRGDFEQRLKQIMNGISNEENPIVYIDEIHNIVGAGKIGEGSNDASNMLKPYLEDGKIRFIGTTTYQEYNRYFASSKGIVRRFQQIDIQEPSIDETVQIISGLISNYEKFHHVRYDADAVSYAVQKSAQLIVDRFLPDKAIDLIDEAGAYRHLHPLLNKNGDMKAERYQKVDVKLVGDILSKVCKIEAKALTEEANDALKTLESRVKSQIYGQDEAVRRVVEAVEMSKAGLNETDKPIASFLLVGPTGVGKTELCKVLAKELGIGLVRFDMSEYTEKHTVAKLIGSPAGYVGYEDGGLLTDAIRKNPNCVLLLDEIEKAHSDIYNILLQVMDYARLTDNKGNKADFKNVILVMTSNAGAQYAHQASVGFSGNITKGESMLQTVKKTFKPEFINRLSGTVVFGDMDETMASLILDKKLRQLSSRLAAKNVTMHLTDEARKYLLRQGFTKQYGAREMDRVIQNNLNPLLMREILYGSLVKGGDALVTLKDDKLTLSK